MSLTLELPPRLEDELKRYAEREDVSPAEHATLLLSLATALLSESRATSFQQALKAFVAARSLEPEAVGSIFEELFTICLRRHLDPLSVDFDADLTVIDLSPTESISQAAGRFPRKTSARGKYAHLGVTTEDVARGHREDIALEERGWE